MRTAVRLLALAGTILALAGCVVTPGYYPRYYYHPYRYYYYP